MDVVPPCEAGDGADGEVFCVDGDTTGAVLVGFT